MDTEFTQNDLVPDIVERETYLDILERNKQRLEYIYKILTNSGEQIEGNCFTEHLTGKYLPHLMNKQRNIFSLGVAHNNILEIGFNAGHSSLLMLVENPDS